MRALLISIALVAATAASARAQADEPEAELHLASRPHAGVPFELQMSVEGFAEQPAPEQPRLAIPGAQVTPLGVQPNVMRSVQIINGRRSEGVRVTWVLRWRVVPGKDGVLHVPAITVTQNGKRATAPGGDTAVDAVPETSDMKLDLTLPDRPVFIGENTPIKLVWQFRGELANKPTFSIPLLDSDAVTTSAPPSKPAAGERDQQLPLTVHGTELAVPYTVDKDGGYTRITMQLYVSPRTAGHLDAPPPTVTAELATGPADFFGRASSRLFRATGAAHALDVKPLPETDRPADFAGAVGTSFSISAATSRSVVQLGEPVEIAITVKSDQRLDTLSLGRLDGAGGLPRDKFTLPADPPTGELSPDGKTKTFKVTAQVIAPTAEIPAISLPYFDPQKQTYQVVQSDPIALSVKGGNLVGANDVVAMAPAPKAGSGGAAGSAAESSLVGADLALSDPSDGGAPLGGTLLWLLVGALYAVPLGLLVATRWTRRTAAGREEAAEVRAARRRVADELARAQTVPARDTAGPLASALRGLARAQAHPLDDHARALLAKIETESYAPGAADQPLSADLRISVEKLMSRWVDEARQRARTSAPARAHGGGAAALIAILAAGALASTLAARDARADAGPARAATAPASHDPDAAALADGRTAYQDAMQRPDAAGRRAAFARAEVALADAARQAPDRPELLADWGNAALGAGDVATATLAYRRALALDPGNARARRNLEWLRSNATAAVRPPASVGAADTLLFFHAWTPGKKLLAGAVAFAIAILLLVPWRGRRSRAAPALAAIPLAIWLALTLSFLLADRHAHDGVVMQSSVLRAADSAGAPAALAQALPPGTEVTILERRDAWTKLQLPLGQTGWVPDGTVEAVAP